MNTMLFHDFPLVSHYLLCFPLYLHCSSIVLQLSPLCLSPVEYGLDRMNVELSEWMRGEEVDEGQLAPMPYLVTKGYNSVVWSRLYSQENFQSTDDKRKVCQALFLVFLITVLGNF